MAQVRWRDVATQIPSLPPDTANSSEQVASSGSPSRPNPAQWLVARRWLVVWVIFACGLALRLFWMLATDGDSNAPMKDQLIELTYARQWSEGETSALYLGLAPADAGYRTPSFLINALHGTLFALWPSPYPILVLIALLNALALPVCYRILTLLWPTRPLHALMAIAMMAVLPHPVSFSIGIWNANYIVPFASLSCLGAVHWAIAGRQWGLILASVAAALLAQMHLIGVFLVPALLSVGLVLRPRTARTTLLAAALPWLFLYGGYLAIDATLGFPNTAKVRHGSGKLLEPEALRVISNAWFTPSVETSGLVTRAHFKVDLNTPELGKAIWSQLAKGAGRYAEAHDALLGTFVIAAVLGALHLVYIAASYRFVLARTLARLRELGLRAWPLRRPAEVFVALWLLAPVLALLLTTKAHTPRYTQVAFPFLFLFQAAYYFSLSRTRWYERLFRLALPVLLVYGAYLCISYPSYVSSQTRASATLVPSFANLEKITTRLRADARSQGRRPELVDVDISATSDRRALGFLQNYVRLTAPVGEERLAAARYVITGAGASSPPGAKVVGRVRSQVLFRLP